MNAHAIPILHDLGALESLAHESEFLMELHDDRIRFENFAVKLFHPKTLEHDLEDFCFKPYADASSLSGSPEIEGPIAAEIFSVDVRDGSEANTFLLTKHPIKIVVADNSEAFLTITGGHPADPGEMFFSLDDVIGIHEASNVPLISELADTRPVRLGDVERNEIAHAAMNKETKSRSVGR